MHDLTGRTVAILATDGFEQCELTEPRRLLAAAGARVEVVSPRRRRIRAWVHGDWGDSVGVDRDIREVTTSDYDALLLPGGQINADVLRTHDRAVAFVRAMHAAGKPIAAVCHGPALLVEAGLLRGRRATSFHSIKTDVRNAGAVWTDVPVEADGGIITARRRGDIEGLCAALAAAMLHDARQGEVA